MLVCRLSKRMFLAFPGEGAWNRQYVIAKEFANKSFDMCRPAVEAMVEGRYREFLARNPEFLK